MKYSISKIKSSLENGGTKKLFMALLLVLTMCIATLSTTVTVAHAGTTGGSGGGSSSGTISDLESNLGLQDNDGSGTTNMLGNIIGIISMLARVVGVLLGVYGLYKLIVAFKDQDANGITQGIVLLAVGIILIMFETLVEAIFGIKVG